MTVLTTGPGRLDIEFQPSNPLTIQLTFPDGYLSGHTWHAEGGSHAFTVDEDGDVLTLTMSDSHTGQISRSSAWHVGNEDVDKIVSGYMVPSNDGVNNGEYLFEATVMVDTAEVNVLIGPGPDQFNALVTRVGQAETSIVSLDARVDVLESTDTGLDARVDVIEAALPDKASTSALTAEAAARAAADATKADAAATTAALANKAPIESQLKATAVKTSAYTAAPGEFVPVDTTSGTVAIQLPNNPADGTVVAVKRVAGAVNNATVTCQGSDVFNVAAGSTTATLSLLNTQFTLIYKATGRIWFVETSLAKSALDATYLGVAGGTMTGPIVLAADGSVAMHPVTYQQLLANGSSGRQLAHASGILLQSGLAGTETDVDSCSITFTVGSRPVMVTAYIAWMFGAGTTVTVQSKITDGSNVTKSSTVSVISNAVALPVTLYERISTPGTYTRKLRVVRTAGSANFSVGLNDATYINRIMAQEV